LDFTKSKARASRAALDGCVGTNTEIPARVWFLTKNKKACGQYRDRNGEVRFNDARQLGYMKDRARRRTLRRVGKTGIANPPKPERLGP
jgi:hypothetical protein